MSAVTDNLEELPELIAACRPVDRPSLHKKLRFIRNRLKQDKPADRELKRLLQRIDQSRGELERRRAALPRPAYPDGLPIVERREDILAALEKHQVVVVCGETGSGKTTQLPKLCLELGRGVGGLIGHTQPRRIAARTLSARIAEELNDRVGGTVGYKIRFSDRVSPDTYIKVMTDGILLAETQSDPDLLAYDTLIIDEAHERSLNIDFILGYIKRLLPRRPDLKVIITSATIDPERFSEHFDKAPIVEVSGRTYPVEVRYRPLQSEDEDDQDRDRGQGILDAVDELAREGPGDVLIFLPGERDIRDATALLRKHHPPGTEILPLYSRLSHAQQNQVFQAHKGRRIVLATNVAETSLTVPGIRYVIDTGLVRISRYSYRTKVQRLPIEPVSQASANQRAGRCGRVAPGICIRLYSEDDYLNRPEFTDPEVLRTNLASVILQMLTLKLGDIEDFPFVEPPDPRFIRDGFKLLFELGAVDERQTITALGRQLARLPVDVRLGRMLIAGDTERCLKEMLIITSALAIQDPRERPMEAQQAADEKHAAFTDERSDFLSFLKLWDFYHEQAQKLSQNKLRKLCKTNFLSYVRMREWSETFRQLKSLAQELGLKHGNADVEYSALHRALLTGLLNNIAFKDGEHEYTGARNLKLYIFPGSGVFKKKPKWIVAAELVETGKRYARTVAKIEPQWAESLAPHLVKKTYLDPHWEKNRGRAVAREQVSLYGLILHPGRTVDFSRVDPPEARRLFILHGLVHGELKSKLPFFKHNRAERERIEALEAKSRRQDILSDENDLYDYFARYVPDTVANIKDFEQWYKSADRETQQRFFLDESVLMQHDAAGVTGNAFPETLDIQGMALPLKYHFEPGAANDGVTVKIPVAALNQIQPARFDWLVPGLLEEKMTALIKSLPKSLRRNFVPAPEFARACLQALSPQNRPLHECLGEQLHRMTGIEVPESAWQFDALPEHLIMNFHLVAANNKILAAGRDLESLREQVGEDATDSFTELPAGEWERDGIERWDVGELPESVAIEQQGVTLKGFPALVDEDGEVCLRLLDAPEKAATEHRAGVLRLFRHRAAKSVKYLEKNLPEQQSLCLLYAAIGTCEQLKADLLHKVLDAALYKETAVIRDPTAFERAADRAESELVTLANDYAVIVKDTLQAWREARARMKGAVHPERLASMQDIQSQLAHLIYPGFIRETDTERLRHLPRYLQAVTIRLEKLEQDPPRDVRLMNEVLPYWRVCESRLEAGDASAEFGSFRWLVEEFRVSLFAQKLGTAETVSVKRLDKARGKLA